MLDMPYALSYFANMPTTTISARVDAEEAIIIEALAKEEGCDRSTLIKSLLRRGVRVLRLERAVASYAAEEVSLSRAAEKAGVSIWDFLALMPENNLNLHYDVAELEEDLLVFKSMAES
jgi:predicted HTH domain antitoxin